MSDMEWKVGDWCYYDFDLHQVREVDAEGRVTDLSNGFLHCGSRDFSDEMFPVSLELKVISESVAADKRAVKDAERGVGLNWPEIAWKFKQIWIDWASDPTRKEGWRQSYDFREAVIRAMRETYAIEVSGVRVFGR